MSLIIAEQEARQIIVSLCHLSLYVRLFGVCNACIFMSSIIKICMQLGLKSARLPWAWLHLQYEDIAASMSRRLRQV